MPEHRQPGAALAGGQDGATTPPTPEVPVGERYADRPASDGSIETHGSAARRCGGTSAADPWPDWARPQLRRAVEIANGVPAGESVAVSLYLDWFNPVVACSAQPAPVRPLAGIYRSAHAGSTGRVASDGIALVDRHDVVGTDGWWRTWGTTGTPPRTRPGSLRLMFTPYPDRLADFVRTATAALLASPHPWTLACATSPRRVRRCAAAVLDVPALDALPAGMLDALGPALRPEVPPLCLPLRPGVAMSCSGSGFTAASFGEQRCHLIALALRRSSERIDPLSAIAEVFTAHGIDAATPYRCG